MKNILFLFVIITSIAFSQKIDENYFKENPEAYFRFSVSAREELKSLTRIISIDNVKGNIVYAYANEQEFTEFEKLNYPYTILTRPSKQYDFEMSDNIEGITDWNVYPTYDAYIAMMYQFQTNYPNLCRIVDGGNTVQGRKILFAVISDNVNQHEAEPQFMYTSSMHGDELTGYVLTLRLIDSLLTTYGTNSRITNLVNNVEIWINPLANPDGTFYGGNNTVNGATRYNYNGYDLNRNFPDPVYGIDPSQQIEVTRFRAIAEANNFALVANFHGGTEVINYPWDTWTNAYPDYRHHPDELWYQYISHLYADTCQANAPSTYMNGYDDGITNGGDWYVINGGRQDFTNYYRWGREVTMEISDTKLIPASQLPAHWNYNRKSLIRYMENVLHGVIGLVSDSIGNPIVAKVTVINHDADNSEVYSDATGFYLRMLSPGTYSFKFEAQDFYPKTVNNIVVSTYTTLTTLDVQLTSSIVPVELTSFTATNDDNKVTLNWITATETNNAGFEIHRRSPSPTPSLREGAFDDWQSISFINGNGTTTEPQHYSYIDGTLKAGKYQYRLKQIDFNGSYDYSNIVEVEVGNPKTFMLNQNYPNPFNPGTKISFTIPEKSFITLKIYDVLGKVVATLLAEERSAGSYEEYFNANNLSSGLYFYELKSDKFTQTKKMLLLQ